MDPITQISAGGIFALLVINTVLNFLKDRNGHKPSKNGNNKDLSDIKQLITELHRWHDQKDSDGVYVWYVRRSLEEAISNLAASSSQLAESIKYQATVLERLVNSQDLLRKDVEDFRRDK